MRVFAAIAIWLALWAAPAVAFDGRISQAFVSNERLWFVENFALWSADLGGNSATKHVSDGVVGLAKGRDTIWIARIAIPSARPGPGGELRVYPVRLDGELGDPVLRLVLKPDEVVRAAFIYEGEVFVLTPKRLISTKAGRQMVQPAAIGKVRGRMAAVAGPTHLRGEVFIGFDYGEWGGGLLYLSLKNARGKVIRSKDARPLCEGVLNPDCDPVTSVIHDPDSRVCVLASVGLRHFFQRGRIVRICPNGVELVYSEKSNEALSELAFFGIAPSRIGFWAVSAGEILKFENGKLSERQPLQFKKTSAELLIARPNAEVLVLRSGIRRENSVSGWTPILVSTLP